MIQRNEIIQHLNELMEVDNIEDYCVNGLQVEGCEQITRISVGVSASERFFNESNAMGANLLIVHHGLFWKRGTPYPFKLTGLLRRRVKYLLDHDINLAAFHLPLDRHPEYGNNVQIMNALNINIQGSMDVGYWGSMSNPVPFDDFRRSFDALLPHPSTYFAFGLSHVHKIAVVSGGSSHLAEKVAFQGSDTFITGEFTEPVVRMAEELGLNIIAAGHYNSERFGPIALCKYLKTRYQIPIDFIDIPNPV